MSKESNNNSIMCMWRLSDKPTAETVIPYNRLLYPFDLATPLPSFWLSLPMPASRCVSRKFEGATLLDLFQQIHDIYQEPLTTEEITARYRESGENLKYYFTDIYGIAYDKIRHGVVVKRLELWDKRSPIFLDFSDKQLPFRSIWIYAPP